MTCPSTCPLNTFGQSCRDCDTRCMFCTGYGPAKCLLCNSIDQAVTPFTERQRSCMMDFGYYKNQTTGSYVKCDSRCLTCDDGSNKCPICAKDAFKTGGEYCVAVCPANYRGNLESGMCEMVVSDGQCGRGQYLKNSSCVACANVKGTFANDQGVCKETCGKGYTLGINNIQCDDGNLIDGDGCSSTCEIESGYQC